LLERLHNDECTIHHRNHHNLKSRKYRTLLFLILVKMFVLKQCGMPWWLRSQRYRFSYSDNLLYHYHWCTHYYTYSIFTYIRLFESTYITIASGHHAVLMHNNSFTLFIILITDVKHCLVCHNISIWHNARWLQFWSFGVQDS